MKIIKRDFARPSHNFTLWLIPTLTYLIQKVGGMQFNEYEYVWWVAIPSLICLWGLINWKIKK
jgi:hypothetical protein